MINRRVCCCAFLATIALAGVAPSAAEEGPACPPNLRVWRSNGNAEPGGQWQADVLKINGDIAILREVLIRFGDGTLPPDEARWFDPPSVLEPDALRTRTLSFMGEELRAFCRHLTGSQIDMLREKSRPRCLETDDGARMMLRGMLTVTDAEVEESNRLTDGGIGVAVGGEDVAEDELECERVEELAASFDLEEFRESNNDVFDSVYAMLEEMVGTDGLVETGLAAVPATRYLLGVLRERDEGRVPDNLPSEFYLTVISASGPYAESLALERMLTADDADEEVALKLLGDYATPAVAPLLQLKLRASSAENRPQIGALALRALLAADADVARLEAMPLLSNPAFVRPALGVFALTDPILRDDLESLDPADTRALEEAGARVLAYLQAKTSE
jgi:hypothetical protein